MYLYLAIYFLCFTRAFGHSVYKAQIPNGDRVPNPCTADPSDFWSGVGHTHPGGAGAVNLFGYDFASAGHVWTYNLCMNDSDGDGQSNGVELGDPQCQNIFNAGNTQTQLQSPTGHPGVCEPLSDPKCVTINNAIGIVCQQ